MSTSSVSLSSSVRANLEALKTTSELLDAASERLSSGKKVSSAIDNPTSYFKAESYTTKADNLSSRLTGMEAGASTISSADDGITSISSYLDEMQGLIEDALSTSDSDSRVALGEEFNELISQISSLAQDSGYSGINLLYGNDSDTIQFSDTSGSSTLTLSGINISTAESGVDSSGELGSSSVTVTAAVSDGSGGTVVVSTAYALTLDADGSDVVGIKSAGTSGDSWEINWGGTDYQTTLTELESEVESMESALETQSSVLSNNLSIITTREDFTSNLVDILENGADALTSDDTTTDAALVTSLETSESLAVSCLALASNTANNALTLIESAS